MNAGAGKADNDVLVFNGAAVDYFIFVNQSYGESRKVKAVCAVHSRHFSSLAAEQCAEAFLASVKYAFYYLLKYRHIKLPASGIVEEK